MDKLERTFTGVGGGDRGDPRVLLAAMQPRTVHCVRSAASNLDFEVEVAEDIEQFRAHLDRGDPGLVIVDLNVPDSFGVGAIRHLQASATRAGLLLISGLDAQLLRSAERMIVDSGLRLQAVLRRPLDAVSIERALSRAHQEMMFSAAELSRALGAGEIRVAFQPVVDLHLPGSWRIESFEALARWRHPQHGLILPVYFVPLAESSGLMAELTRRVIQVALAEARVMLRARARASLSFNLSTQLLERDDFAQELEDLAGRAGVDPARIAFEISEPGIGEPARMSDALARLRDAGFGLCIDDFGVGQSSLARFCRLPFSRMKIHRSLIRELAESDEARIVVELLLDLSRRLSLKVGAEGVESRSVVEMLRGMGCDLAQGFYFAEPAPLDRFLRPPRAAAPARPAGDTTVPEHPGFGIGAR